MSMSTHGRLDNGLTRRTQAAVKGFGPVLDAYLVGSRGRPRPLPVGHVFPQGLRIDRLLRSGEFKHDYIVSPVPGSEAALRCWECGATDTPAEAPYCAACDMPLESRAFVLSERWHGAYKPFVELAAEALFHPSLSRYLLLFEEKKRLYVLCDAPPMGSLSEVTHALEAHEIIALGLTLVDVLRFLEASGVRVARLQKEHITLGGGEGGLLDPELGAVAGGRSAERYRGRVLEQLGQVLRELCPYDAPELRGFLDELCEGRLERWEDIEGRLLELEQGRGRGEERVRVAAMSDVGLARSLNEDCWGYERFEGDLGIFVVADGMGGHDNGEVASDMAVRTLLQGVRHRLSTALKSRPLSEGILENLLAVASQESNNAVKAFADRRRTDMGTTLVGALVYRSELAIVCNVGDSRGYLFRDGALTQISQDHSLVANLVAMGKITAEAARNHPHANILIRTVGKEKDVEIDVFRQPLQSGDILLLCSDGLWGEVEDEELAAILEEHASLDAACQELIRVANQRGGRDNITAILLKIE